MELTLPLVLSLSSLPLPPSFHFYSHFLHLFIAFLQRNFRSVGQEREFGWNRFNARSLSFSLSLFFSFLSFFPSNMKINDINNHYKIIIIILTV